MAKKRPTKISLTRIRDEARGCRACDLYKHATQTVFGEGPARAPLMLIGEQPGDAEDLSGHPFVGPAGKLLDRGGLQYSTHESWGDPAREIVRYAESGRFSGIVMASDGLGSVSEMVLGSVTAKVLRTSRVPVEVVPASIRSRLRAYAGPTGLGAGIAVLLYAALD